MGGAVSSAGGYLGLSDGPQASVNNENVSLNRLRGMSDWMSDPDAMRLINQATQTGDVQSAMNQGIGGGSGAQRGLLNQLATGATTGSNYATQQVENNPILGSLYGRGGQLGQVEDQLTGLYNQGFNLKPEDQSLYGQQAGSIARQFGQQGNQVANDLASRGMSASGAAGAQFSGLAGNQNEMLAQAQQQIAQQRFQNTMGQIGQYQNFINSMGANANNAINQQYGRQLAGAENEAGQVGNAAGLEMKQNDAANTSNMNAQQMNISNKPQNFMDTNIGMMNNMTGSGSSAFGKGAGQAAAAGLFA